MPLLHVPFYDNAFLDDCARAAGGGEKPPLFLFGDNIEGWGKGGQAATLRDITADPGTVDLPSLSASMAGGTAIGVATKISPRQGLDEAIWPEWRATFRESWRRAIDLAMRALQAGHDVCWPADGIGTGRADLPRSCPSAWRDLCEETRRLFDFDASLPEALSGQARKGLTLVVCGGRDYKDERAVTAVLDVIRRKRRLIRVIEGDCRGADRMAGRWARRAAGVRHSPMPADWDRYGPKRAGFIRNSAMRDELVNVRTQTGCAVGVLAFPGGDGTAMMVEIAGKAGIKTLPATVLIEKLFPARSAVANISPGKVSPGTAAPGQSSPGRTVPGLAGGRMESGNPARASNRPETPARPTAPADTLWMIATDESLPKDAFLAGPSPDLGEMVSALEEGQLLVGRTAQGIVSVHRMADGALVEIGPDGVEPDRAETGRTKTGASPDMPVPEQVTEPAGIHP